MTIAITGAVFLQKFEEAAIIVVLFGLGEALEDYGIRRSRLALENLINSSPKTAELKSGNDKVPIADIKIGDIIIVRPGDKIGLDGEIVFGDSLVDESTITGEPLPKSKIIGDKIYAGSINSGGYLEVKVLKEAKDSTLNKIVQLTGEAVKKKAESQKFIEKFARFYTPAVSVLAILLFIIPVVFLNGSAQFWLVQSLTILLISCPCALVISTPISIFSALGNASQKGVLVKGGKVIEDLSSITEVGFDKTKTLTVGKPEVTDIIPFNGFTKEEILSCSAGLGEFSEHPLSKGIVEEAKQGGINIHSFKNFKSIQGKGIIGDCTYCTDVKHCLGKFGLINDKNGSAGLNELMTKEKDRLEKNGKTVVFLGDEKRIKGLIALSDKIKSSSKQTIVELKKQNVSCYMVTGDNDGAAQYVANELDITEVYSGKLPEEKVNIITDKVNQNIIVAMVGDGVNDAPSLASANVGIAMGSLGSDIAIESADVALMNDDLNLVPYLIELSRKTVKKIKFNTYFDLGTKLIFLMLAVVGLSNLSLAIFADVGVTLLVVLNGLSLYKFDQNY
jgi:Cd2+/Zn2+-exporting ATPase